LLFIISDFFEQPLKVNHYATRNYMTGCHKRKTDS